MSTEHPMWLIGIYVALVGLVVGSWTASVTIKATGPEQCSACGPRSSWQHRAPVISWFSATRQCPSCDHPGQPERPLIELATAGLFLGLTLALYGQVSAWVILAVLWAAAAGVSTLR